jgi:hypothetical protein
MCWNNLWYEIGLWEQKNDFKRDMLLHIVD